MKKASLVMITVTIVFCAFAGGFFLGRNLNHSPISLSASHTPGTTVQADTEASAASDTKSVSVNLNTATVEDFMTLPGIGEVLARRIVAYRDANGPFESIADLTKVEGIGDKKLEEILDHITLGG